MFTRLSIENLRSIKNLNIDDLGSINILVGPNNCGKTTILESIFLLIGMSNPQLSININNFRDLLLTESNDLRFNFRDLDYNNTVKLDAFDSKDKERSLIIKPIYSSSITKDIKSISSDVDVDAETKDAIGLNLDFKRKSPRKNRTESFHSEISMKDNQLKISIDNKYKENLNGRFLSSRALYANLSNRIDQIQKSKKKSDLIDALKQIDTKIVDIALSRNGMIYVDIGAKQMMPINLMGDGFVKVCSIVSNLLISRDGILLIDEVENGLHFESQAILWKSIIVNAKKFNVQVFITTHSYEALSIFVKTVRENNFKPDFFRLFTVQRLPDESHKAYKYNFEDLLENINNQTEIRGKLLGIQ